MNPNADKVKRCPTCGIDMSNGECANSQCPDVIFLRSLSKGVPMEKREVDDALRGSVDSAESQDDRLEAFLDEYDPDWEDFVRAAIPRCVALAGDCGECGVENKMLLPIGEYPEEDYDMGIPWLCQNCKEGVVKLRLEKKVEAGPKFKI